jgi:nicotinamidase-related amidase
VGFSADYREQPEQSPLFGPARKNGVFTLGTWATAFHPKAAPLADETVLLKHRVSAFYGTPLDLVLRNTGVRRLLIAGVATDLAVQSAARDAHDRDYVVTVVSDCCASATDRDHEDALRLLSKVAGVETLDSLAL